MKAGLRVDIDCAADVMAIPALIKILKKHDSKATFFIATGKDETFRNVRHYNNSNIFDLPLRRYLPGFFHALSKRHVESHSNLKLLLDTDHEIGLHGYGHYEWMNHLRNKSKEDISKMISTGCGLFKKEFGKKPGSFASPGFMTTDRYLLSLDEFGFDYSSDYYGDKIFYPEINGTKLKTIQIPVSMPSICESGKDDRTIFMQIKKKYEKGHFIFYIHPSCEPIFRRDLLEKMLDFTGHTQTLLEIYEDSSDI